MLFEELITVLDPEPHPAPLNMAVDEMLLRSASVPCLRVYRWKRPSVSFGYFSRHAEVAREWPGRDLVRRWTGGGVVPHGEDVTYTLVLPLDCPLVGMGAPELYRLIHERIATVLGEGGTLAGSAAARVSDACFENPAMHDVLYGGRKVAGAAQRRTRSGLLHQGSIQCGSPAEEERIRERLSGLFCGKPRSRELTAIERETADELARNRYASEAWTRRF